jgi:aryl-alcohol dehydrogenase-like predicted oxidoreductase
MTEQRLPTRPLGRSGLNVSVLGLGTVKFGRNAAVKYPQPFDLPSMDALAALLEQASAAGINLLDTAPAYGSSEQRLGELLAGQRERWILCSKAGETFDDGQSAYDFRPDSIRRSLERSLARLRTDHIDILLLHSDGRDREILQDSGALETLLKAREEGLVRAVGISHKTPEGGALALQCCDVIMATLNLDYREEAGLIAEAGRQGVGVLIKKLFGSGHAALDPQHLRDSLALGLHSPGVSSLVLGTITPAHLASNVALALRLLDKPQAGLG